MKLQKDSRCKSPIKLNKTHSETYMWCVAIWYHLYNLKNVKNTLGGLLILVKLHASASNFTKIDTPWVFFMFFKLYKWYQIAQRITNTLVFRFSFQGNLTSQSLKGLALLELQKSRKSVFLLENSGRLLCTFRIAQKVFCKTFFSQAKLKKI